MTRIFAANAFHVPSYKSSHPDPSTTVNSLKWPLCFGKHATILGSYCVPATTPEQEASPKTKLPRLSFSVETARGSEATLFLFDDEDDKWTNFRTDTFANKSCAVLSKYANVVVPPVKGSQRISGERSLKGKEAHLWHVVAVDCARRTCPNVTSANVTFFHPTTDGSREACSADAMSFTTLKSAMVEGWQALSLRNVLNISGVSPFGVVLLYLAFVLFTVLSLWCWWRARGEKDLSKRELAQAAFYLATVTALCYLTMATGNGLLVLRKVGAGRGQAWAYSSAVIATRGDKQNPNPFFDAKYAAARTYPMFFVRDAAWLVSVWLMLHYLAWFVGLPVANKQMAQFAGVGRVVCDLAATSIMGGARWAFWVLELILLVVVVVEVNNMKAFAMRRGKLVTGSYGRLRTVALVSWGVGTVLWVPCAGAKALSSDVDVCAYALLDLASVGAFTYVLLNAGSDTAPATRNAENQRLTESAGGGVDFGGSRTGMRGEDDLGDLEDNL